MVHQVRVNLQDLYSDYESNINLKIAYSVRLCLPEKLISESTSLGIEPTSLSLESNQARYPLSNQGWQVLRNHQQDQRKEADQNWNIHQAWQKVIEI